MEVAAASTTTAAAAAVYHTEDSKAKEVEVVVEEELEEVERRVLLLDNNGDEEEEEEENEETQPQKQQVAEKEPEEEQEEQEEEQAAFSINNAEDAKSNNKKQNNGGGGGGFFAPLWNALFSPAPASSSSREASASTSREPSGTDLASNASSSKRIADMTAHWPSSAPLSASPPSASALPSATTTQRREQSGGAPPRRKQRRSKAARRRRNAFRAPELRSKTMEWLEDGSTSWLSALQLSLWDNVFGPRIEQIWFGTEVVDEDLQLQAAKETLSGELSEDGTLDAEADIHCKFHTFPVSGHVGMALIFTAPLCYKEKKRRTRARKARTSMQLALSVASQSSNNNNNNNSNQQQPQPQQNITNQHNSHLHHTKGGVSRLKRTQRRASASISSSSLLPSLSQMTRGENVPDDAGDKKMKQDASSSPPSSSSDYRGKRPEQSGGSELEEEQVSSKERENNQQADNIDEGVSKAKDEGEVKQTEREALAASFFWYNIEEENGDYDDSDDSDDSDEESDNDDESDYSNNNNSDNNKRVNSLDGLLSGDDVIVGEGGTGTDESGGRFFRRRRERRARERAERKRRYKNLSRFSFCILLRREHMPRFLELYPLVHDNAMRLLHMLRVLLMNKTVKASLSIFSGMLLPRFSSRMEAMYYSILPYPVQTTLFTIKSLPFPFDFLVKAVTSHFQTHGCTVVVGEDEALVNALVNTLSLFQSQDDRKRSSLITNHGYVPGLLLQGVRGTSISENKLIQSLLPTTVVNLTTKSITQTKIYHEYVHMRQRFMERELRTLLSLDAPTTTMTMMMMGDAPLPSSHSTSPYSSAPATLSSSPFSTVVPSSSPSHQQLPQVRPFVLDQDQLLSKLASSSVPDVQTPPSSSSTASPLLLFSAAQEQHSSSSPPSSSSPASQLSSSTASPLPNNINNNSKYSSSPRPVMQETQYSARVPSQQAAATSVKQQPTNGGLLKPVHENSPYVEDLLKLVLKLPVGLREAVAAQSMRLLVRKAVLLIKYAESEVARAHTEVLGSEVLRHIRYAVGVGNDADFLVVLGLAERLCPGVYICLGGDPTLMAERLVELFESFSL